jgi:hypothetical protein
MIFLIFNLWYIELWGLPQKNPQASLDSCILTQCYDPFYWFPRDCPLKVSNLSGLLLFRFKKKVQACTPPPPPPHCELGHIAQACARPGLNFGPIILRFTNTVSLRSETIHKYRIPQSRDYSQIPYTSVRRIYGPETIHKYRIPQSRDYSQIPYTSVRRIYGPETIHKYRIPQSRAYSQILFPSVLRLFKHNV